MKSVIFSLLLALGVYWVSPVEAHAAREDEDIKAELALLKKQVSQMQAMIESMQERIHELQSPAGQPRYQDATPLPGMGKPAFELPDISVIGNVIGNYGTDRDDPNRNKVYLDEMELAIQGYLYPDIWGNFIVALERESDGDYEVHIEEGYIDFMATPIPGLSVLAGKKLVGFGKVNPVHAHHWNYVDRPAVLESFLGDEGLAGQGVNMSYLLPLPFFAQADFGVWHVDAEEPDSEHELGLAKETYTTRLWTSFALTENQELELGASGAIGSGAHYRDHRDKVQVGGLDVTYRLLGDRSRRLMYQGEALMLRREIPDETFYRWGLYQFLNYRFDKNWDAGIRFDWTQSPSFEKEDDYSFSGILTRRLTETTLLRLQYKFAPEDNDHTVYLQAIFGLGPHAHHLE